MATLLQPKPASGPSPDRSPNSGAGYLATIFRSVYIWLSSAFLILVFFPFIFLVWAFERNDLHPRTSRWVMLLSRLSTRINPAIRLRIEGKNIPDANQAYVVVANHQSMTDIPLISHLPVQLKWVAKASLFKVPFLGQFMKWQGDIPVDFKAADKKRRVMEATTTYIERGCNVIFFPEGRRSVTGDVARFHNGAFELAIQTGVPVLPIAIDGLWDLLPMHSWKFGAARDIHLKILEPISTEGLGIRDAAHLREKVRFQIMNQIGDWRGVSPDSIDGIWKPATNKTATITPGISHENPFPLFQHD